MALHTITSETTYVIIRCGHPDCKRSGFTNLADHIASCHPNFHADEHAHE